MILVVTRGYEFALCVLHVCGDDPNLVVIGIKQGGVFSTYVEMILDG